MPRYFFDIRDDGDLADLRAAKVEAANTLAGIARDADHSGGDNDVAIEVRSDGGLVFHAAFVLHRSKQ